MSKDMIDDRLSAWLDGELESGEAPRVQDPAARARCAVWWLIGDVVRREPVLQTDFTSRVMAQIDLEPTVFSPVSVPARGADPARRPLPRWAALAASFAGVAVVGWVAFGGKPPVQAGVAPVAAQASSAAAVLAAAVPAVRATSMSVTARRAPVDDERGYLLAHQAYGPGVQMAGVSGYVRPVSMDDPLQAR